MFPAGSPRQTAEVQNPAQPPADGHEVAALKIPVNADSWPCQDGASTAARQTRVLITRWPSARDVG